MTEKELYRALGDLTKSKDSWKDRIPFVAYLLDNQSLKITAKALWLLGEMGLQYPGDVPSDGEAQAAAGCSVSADPARVLRERPQPCCLDS